jgi:4a-hydroxytetrahydrobiopterin dehydratase
VKELSAKKCVPCDGGVAPLTRAQATKLRKQLHKDWKLAADAKSLHRSLKFKDFHRTMSIVYATHSIGGLSQNDFICAAKIDRL